MAVKKTSRGKVLGNVNEFSIRQVPTYEGTGKKRRVKTSTIAIFIAKNKLKDGFKNLNEATEFLKTANYNKKTKSFV